MNPQKTGKFISYLRKENNLTQKELSEKLGVSDKAVSKWETGKCYPDIEVMGALALTFGVTVNDLLSGEKTEAVSRDEAADSNVISIMKRLRSLNKKWCAVFLCAVVAIYAFFVVLLSVSLLPVDFDAGACGGGFSAHIYEKYGDALAREYLSRFPEEDIVSYTLSDTADIDWTGRIIFMEFELTYTLSDILTDTPVSTKTTLKFVGERYWIEKYTWSRL